MLSAVLVGACSGDASQASAPPDGSDARTDAATSDVRDAAPSDAAYEDAALVDGSPMDVNPGDVDERDATLVDGMPEDSAADTSAVDADAWEERFPPALEDRWEVEGAGQALSSPRLYDVDADGILDAVFGYGEELYVPRVDLNGVVALSGASGEVLWNTPLRYVPFTTAHVAAVGPREAESFVFGGRNGELAAIDARSGALVWQWRVDTDPLQDGWVNFYSVVSVPDVDGDGIVDIVAANGGDGRAAPTQPRVAGRLLLVSGADGSLIRETAMPDAQETYMSPLLHTRGGTRRVLVGTGGEVFSGSLFALDLDGWLAPGETVEWTNLYTPAAKGVMAPPMLADVTGDGVDDIALVAFDASVVLIDGASDEVLWRRTDDGFESYSSPAWGYVDDDEVLDVIVMKQRGTFPTYSAAAFEVYSGVDGASLFRRDTEAYFPCSSPIALDLDGGGRSDALVLCSIPESNAPLRYATDVLLFHAEVAGWRRLATWPGGVFATPAVVAETPDAEADLVAVTFRGFAEPPGTGQASWVARRASLGAPLRGAGTFAYLGGRGDSRVDTAD